MLAFDPILQTIKAICDKGVLEKLTSHEARGEIYQATMMRHYKDPQTMGCDGEFCMCALGWLLKELAVEHKDVRR